MPTKNPRLTITLDPPVAAALRRLSDLTGNSQSALIAELLEGSVPVFQRVIATLEAAASASAEMRGKLAADMGGAQERIERQLGFVLEAFDGAAAPLLEEVEVVKRRGRKGAGVRALATAVPPPGAPARRAATPMSNRGVRLPRGAAK